ncbi:gp53-like domain-containing protein [Kosakonia sacchari]|uniref:gp53-like domain-containing protein n=1 Tax=Kosakonia sacchari TaxID=1158459 RepID=UPI001585133A|nr:hypothetical protein [Kosakonia sacchari]
MSAGTLSLTNASTAVTGTDTTFTADLAAGDFIVTTVDGVTYTLPVLSVDSDTVATLVSNYTGPTISAAAWYAVPRATQNQITAALVAQTTEAMRGLNADKANWQQILTGTGNVTVTLPDGTSFTGPTWNSLATSLSGLAKKGDNSDITSLSGLTTPLSLAQGGLGSTTADGGRTALGLGTAATRNVGVGPDNIPDMSSQGVGIGNSLGWQKYPNGMIRQWGVSSAASGPGASVSITFPVGFPNACLQLKLYPISDDIPAVTLFMPGAVSNLSATAWAVARITAAGLTISAVASGSTTYWEAWGN